MPRFLTSGGLGIMRSFYSEQTKPYTPIYNNYILPNSRASHGSYDPSCEPAPAIDRQTVLFISTVATKLLDLTTSIDDRIETIQKNCKGYTSEKLILASVDTPNMNISIGPEYVIYVQKHGPPKLGQFDPDKLAEIRAELGI